MLIMHNLYYHAQNAWDFGVTNVMHYENFDCTTSSPFLIALSVMRAYTPFLLLVQHIYLS
jgi:hypothetical protein